MSQRIALSRDKVPEFIRMWNAGTSKREIVRRLGVSKGSVSHLARKFNLPARYNAPKRVLTDAETERLRELWAAEVKNADIAELMGIHVGSVSRFAQRAGLPPRTIRDRRPKAAKWPDGMRFDDAAPAAIANEMPSLCTTAAMRHAARYVQPAFSGTESPLS